MTLSNLTAALAETAVVFGGNDRVKRPDDLVRAGEKMIPNRIMPFILVLVAGLIARSGLAAPTPVGSLQPPARVLAVSSNPRVAPAPAPPDFAGAIDLVAQAGARGSLLSWTWKALEPSPGVFKLDEVKEGLSYLGNTRGLDLLVGLQVINTTAKEVPSDLAAVPFDADVMKTRFHALVDALRPHLNRRVKYLSIGNEVDVYLTTHPQEWDAYKRFYRDGLAYVHAVAPWIKVGVTVTYDGAVGHKGQIADLNSRSDVFILTYYPLGSHFIPRPPDAPMTDIAKMVELASRWPVILQEVGYPSSAVLASSELKQAQFVSEVFRAWNTSASRIPFLNFFLLHDLPAQLCEELAQYYGLPHDRNFQAFLCSLGLRYADGRPKAAWPALVKSARTFGLK